MTGGQTVDLVVHHDVGQVHIPAGGVGEMVSADAIGIAIPARNDDGEFMIGHLGAGRHCQSPTVNRVHAISVEVSGKIG